MVALTADRNTPAALGDQREGPAAAAQLVYAGSIVMRNATGYIVKGQTALNLVAVGRAEARVDNTLGANGALSVKYRAGTYRFANLAADPVVLADIGKACFVVDDQTVAKTSGAATRSKAGVVDNVDAQGVWVRFDEALTRITA